MFFSQQTRTRQKYSAADQHQLLSSEIPGTIGFEVEDLFFYGKGLGVSVGILVKEPNGQQIIRYQPHEYFKAEQPSLPGQFDQIGAYGKSIACSALMDITLDVVRIPEGGFIHVLEFVTVPLAVIENTHATLKFFSKTINDLYAYASNMQRAEKSIVELDDWMKSYNAKDYAGDYPVSKSKILVPENTALGKTAHPYLTIARPIDPLFAIHVNTSILLEQMYTVEMREAFPIFNDYPPVSEAGKSYGLKDWPSCRRNEAFEDFELKLTKHVNTAVDGFFCLHLKGLKPYSQERIKGFLRTLVYCYCMETYCESDRKQFEFPSNRYYTSSDKDFFLHGIPKIQFDWIAKNGLITHEKNILKAFLSKDSGIKELESVFLDVLKKIYFSSSAKPWFLTKKSTRIMEMMDIHEFIRQVLILPLVHNETRGIKMLAKTLESSLPRMTIEGETVVVPVLEFRAPIGNGCNLAELENLLTTQLDYASAFAKKGFEAIEEYSARHVNKF